MSVFGMIFAIISFTLPSYIDNSNSNNNNNNKNIAHTGSAIINIEYVHKKKENQC